MSDTIPHVMTLKNCENIIIGIDNMDKIEVEIDRKGRIWHLGMRYFSEQEIHGSDWNEHPEDEYQPTEEEIHCCGG